MSRPVTTPSTTTAQPQPTSSPQPQLQPQHRSHPSRDDELVEETFKDSGRQPFRCGYACSPYWYVAIRGMSHEEILLMDRIPGALRRPTSAVVVAELVSSVVNFAVATNFKYRVEQML